MRAPPERTALYHDSARLLWCITSLEGDGLQAWYITHSRGFLSNPTTPIPPEALAERIDPHVSKYDEQ
jgi:hypothetical protein